jgi:ABC-type uncharacterized transport system substrate-binding protein
MKALAVVLAVLLGVVPGAAWSHPHIWISQLVRVVAKDGKFTHVEIEWRFDPFSSEIEIPLIDENGDGKFSPDEVKGLAGEMMPELQKYGFMTWLNTGAKDFRPANLPVFNARIDDPASFKPADWDSTAGDNAGQPMPPNKRVTEPPVPQKRGPRNLVYVMRFALPAPAKVFSIATYDPDDFIRIEVDKTSLPAGCTASKHPSYKAEFIRGYPVFADLVSCQQP